ncbi:hypothetical protein CBL_02281 [Carabus blaptoides fortunei]
MPEITDAMYCHQQICIPPTFPYLLRQYAKAAIRSQPTDLLRWSSAYFRALALGITPPVKLRLEYPIPRTHYGLTPGWLKTLLYQLSGSRHVNWPQLYDRWRGACLEVPGLQQIILLGDFQNPAKIPWFRFIAVAAGHLTQNLTNTMILICELLTEEPDGSSAMIPYTTFADLYRFLSNIDANQPRIIRNELFTESNLNLTKKTAQDVGHSENSSSEKFIGEYGEEYSRQDSELDRYLKGIEYDQHGAEDYSPKLKQDLLQHKMPEPELARSSSSCYIMLDPETKEVCKDEHKKDESSEEASTITTESKSTEALGHTPSLADVPSFVSVSDTSTSKTSEEPSSAVTSEVHLGYIDTDIPVVPGIGPIVPEEMVEAVIAYMKECAKGQHRMIMPRNIKHMHCPPLEVFEE